jgi:hypothetical protein
MHIEFWWESQKVGDNYEYLDICGRIILKLSIDKIGWYEME